ncbi:MAG TPA: SsrA-binding protein SmpB [Candidatus Deferrimicrobium sp.]|nr:SsrA-binding protein SmpB [Candidatus Deferrimicrobium sp.]
MKDPAEIRYVARNRKAWHDYEILSRQEAGIELKGSEVKSIREGKINLSDAYATVENGQVILKNLHISPYKMARENPDPIRPRRLLLHKREIRKLYVQTEQKGFSLIPLGVYFKQNVAKIELAVAAGRKKYDKREAIAKAEIQRRLRRATQREH